MKFLLQDDSGNVIDEYSDKDTALGAAVAASAEKHSAHIVMRQTKTELFRTQPNKAIPHRIDVFDRREKPGYQHIIRVIEARREAAQQQGDEGAALALFDVEAYLSIRLRKHGLLHPGWIAETMDGIRKELKESLRKTIRKMAKEVAASRDPIG